jgi:hypothetical protein
MADFGKEWYKWANPMQKRKQMNGQMWTKGKTKRTYEVKRDSLEKSKANTAQKLSLPSLAVDVQILIRSREP